LVELKIPFRNPGGFSQAQESGLPGTVYHRNIKISVRSEVIGKTQEGIPVKLETMLFYLPKSEIGRVFFIRLENGKEYVVKSGEPVKVIVTNGSVEWTLFTGIPTNVEIKKYFPKNYPTLDNWFQSPEYTKHQEKLNKVRKWSDE
jgi:hypothetical protein